MPPPDRSRARRSAVAAVGLVFLFTPAAAWVSGERAAEFENRRLAAFPSPADGWGFFPRLSTWATDHLPLRERAVQAHTRLSEAVFGEAPQYGGEQPAAAAGPVAPQPVRSPEGPRVYPPVVEGEDGWLFLGLDVSAACAPQAPPERTLQRLDRLGALLIAAGKRYVFTIAPDKSTMHPERLPDTYVGDDCAPRAKARFWQRVQARPPVGYVDLRGALERARRVEGADLWRPSDSHWGPRGSLVYAEQVATALDPALWRTSRPVETGPVRLRGDLGSLLGTVRHDEVPGWRLERTGVSVALATPTRMSSTTVGAPLHRPATLVLGDSFTQNARTALAPLFASALIMHPQAAVDERAGAVRSLVESDTVVLELVERDVAGGDVPVVDEAFLTELERALAPAAR